MQYLQPMNYTVYHILDLCSIVSIRMFTMAFIPFICKVLCILGGVRFLASTVSVVYPDW